MARVDGTVSKTDQRAVTFKSGSEKKSPSLSSKGVGEKEEPFSRKCFSSIQGKHCDFYLSWVRASDEDNISSGTASPYFPSPTRKLRATTNLTYINLSTWRVFSGPRAQVHGLIE
ncbi:hypothetical protein TNCV_3109831 [Trichonephila clavipes]|nr:hypothetical protein TNCV_3109831 [Trichonephila clavipes]